MKLIVATCQFPVDGDVERNLRFILRQMKTAKARGAGVVHFPESALSGYPGVDMESFRDFDWDRLQKATRQVMTLAATLGVWVILGSSHRLSGRHKPHNSLYIIDDRGRIVERYDKMFCTGERDGSTGDLKHFSPGDHFCVFKINGIRCGAMICHDFRYPELYREYKRRGVQLMFHAYHNVRRNPAKQRKLNIHGIVVPAGMQVDAANNYMWISATNSSRRASSWASFFVQPNGIIVGSLRKNVTGVLINTVDTSQQFYDASSAWRDRAMRGIYHSGVRVRDPRSEARTSL